VPAVALIEGSLSPGVRLRVAMRWRIAAMTVATRVPPEFNVAAFPLICIET
jgi:hypothetical protein